MLLRALEQGADIRFKVAQKKGTLFVNGVGPGDLLVKLVKKFIKLIIVPGEVPPFR